jgi:hypothetical protein
MSRSNRSAVVSAPSIEAPVAVAEPAPAVDRSTVAPSQAPVGGMVAIEFAALTFAPATVQSLQTRIAPFVRHAPDCVAEPCTCGLRSAIEGLAAAIGQAERYGVPV